MLEDIQNRPLDNIIELYANGYRLEGTEENINQPIIQNLQSTPLLALTVTTVLITGIVAGLIIMILSSRAQKK